VRSSQLALQLLRLLLGTVGGLLCSSCRSLGSNRGQSCSCRGAAQLLGLACILQSKHKTMRTPQLGGWGKGGQLQLHSIPTLALAQRSA
jgi:hypothetical protein